MGKFNRAWRTVGTVQGLYRILTPLSLSYGPPDCVNRNWPFSRVGHVDSKMLLKGRSIANDDLHQPDADSQAEFFNSSCEIQSDDCRCNRSHSRKPRAYSNPNLNFLVERHDLGSV